MVILGGLSKDIVLKGWGELVKYLYKDEVRKVDVVERLFKFVTMVAEKIATKVKGVNCAVWRGAPKQPATIEWE